MTANRIAVIDIGKTNVKLALVDATDLSEIAVLSQPNRGLTSPPYPHFDVESIWAFIRHGLRSFGKQTGVDAISITTHGAAGALLSTDGSLAAPILDYEHTGPDASADQYNALRPPFVETGSARLPMGLNLGAQLHWQFSQDPSLSQRTAHIVTYPQYWAYRLTGALACDVTSLGCHTDLWAPDKQTFSSLVEILGIGNKIALPHKPGDRLGALRPEVAAETGLALGTPVLCGIHDSNASLLPYVLRRAPPFSVVSTGTWVIAMTIGGRKVDLDPTRDALVNVNAQGATVPSARFMGGREFEIIQGGKDADMDDAALLSVATNGPYLMPSVIPESGPFQGRAHHWIGAEPKLGSPERLTALSFYLALMTAECLSLTGHQGTVIIEGPFAKNSAYCAMLSAATQCSVEIAEGVTGTSQGAAMLALDPEKLPSVAPLHRVEPIEGSALQTYARVWQTTARQT